MAGSVLFEQVHCSPPFSARAAFRRAFSRRRSARGSASGSRSTSTPPQLGQPLLAARSAAATVLNRLPHSKQIHPLIAHAPFSWGGSAVSSIVSSLGWSSLVGLLGCS